MDKEVFEDWSQGILTEQDLDYLDVLNQVTDILMMYGSDAAVQERMFSINNYLQKYGEPEGFKERLKQWHEKGN